MAHLSKKLPPLGSLIAFEAAVRLGSFSRAADEIARSQASVSRQIRQLEESLGVVLFERQRHNVVCTTEGEMLGASVRLILGELAHTTERIRSVSQRQNKLTIFTDTSIASAMVSPIIGEFQSLYPKLNIKILSSNESIEDTHEVFDIGLQLGNRAQNRFHTFAIASDAIFPVCSPSFAANYSNNMSCEELGTLPLLHLDDLDRGWPDWRDFLKHNGAEKHQELAGLMFTTYDVCLEVAARGEGVALGWARSVKSKIEEGKLVRLSNFTLPLPDCIYAYLPRLETKSAVAEAFMQVLTNSIEPIQLEA